MIWWYALLGIIVYLLCCAVWFVQGLGQKHNVKTHWYDYIFFLGTMFLAYIIGWLNRKK